jgi:hypothetical protein
MEKGVGAGQGGELSLSLSLSLCAITEGREGIENGGGNDGRKGTRERKRKMAES